MSRDMPMKMTTGLPKARSFAVLLIVGLGACGSEGEAGSVQEPVAAAFEQSEDDWGIIRATARWAYEQGLDSLPMGELVARIGGSFVGTPYVAHTLEVPGDERLVVEVNGLDCVTFVESALAIARLVKSVPSAVLDDENNRYRFMYSGILTRIRYRDGELDGYPSRLHYFSEWISDNDRLGILEDITRRIGGVEDPEPIDFMTTHTSAYRQLEESPDFIEALRSIESELNAAPRVYVPEDGIADIAEQIHTGDIIATTSTVKGLDIAHTGIAVWVDGELRLLHAPLADGVVQVSERALATRIQEISAQDGIMVARPAEVR